MVSRETNRAKRTVKGHADMHFHKRSRAKRHHAAVRRALHNVSNGKDFNLDVKGSHVAARDIS